MNEQLNKLIDQLGVTDPVKAYQARYGLDEALRKMGAEGSSALASALAAALDATIESKDGKGNKTVRPKHNTQARNEIARRLGDVANGEQIDTLTKALADLDVRESARFALERIPGDAATKALCDAAKSAVGVDFRVGTIGALGHRSGTEVVATLKSIAADEASEPPVRLAAAVALSKHPDASSDELISRLAKCCFATVSAARFRLAHTLVAAGQKDAGKKILQTLAAECPCAVHKKAAARCLSAM